MSDFQIDINASHLKDLFDRLEGTQQARVVKRAMTQSGKYLHRWIVQNRLKGRRPRYLDVVSGRLYSSITATSLEPTDTGFQIRIGTNVEYAPTHEFGFRGTVGVRSHIRKRKKSLSLVRAHSRRMNIRKRPFIRPAIESRTNQIKILSIFTKHLNEQLAKKQ